MKRIDHRLDREDYVAKKKPELKSKTNQMYSATVNIV